MAAAITALTTNDRRRRSASPIKHSNGTYQGTLTEGEYDISIHSDKPRGGGRIQCVDGHTIDAHFTLAR